MPKLKLALKVAATVVLLALLLRIADARQVAEAVRSVSPGWLALMYPIALATRWIQAAQLQSVLANVGDELTVRRVFLASALSSLYGLLSPGDVVASFAKWKNLSSATGRKSLVLSAILYNRLVLLLVPLAGGVVALWRENPIPGAPLPEVATAMLIGVIAIGGLLFHPKLGPTFDRIARRTFALLPEFVSRRVEYVLQSLDVMRSIPLRAHGKHLALSAARLVGLVVSTSVLCRALGFDVPIWGLVLLHSVLLVSAHAPLTLGGFGVREAIFMLVLGGYGVSQAGAVAAGLLAFTVRFAMALIGGLYQVALILNWADSRSR